MPPPFDAMMRDILAGSVVEPGLIEWTLLDDAAADDAPPQTPAEGFGGGGSTRPSADRGDAGADDADDADDAPLSGAQTPVDGGSAPPSCCCSPKIGTLDKITTTFHPLRSAS